MLSRLLALLMAVALLIPTAGVVAADPVPTPTASQVPVYRLGADDKVRINVYGEDALNAEYLVGSDGNISFPLLGMVEAKGLTIAELQALLTRRLAETAINDPKVSVDVVEYRPFYVLGEVQKAGQYPYRTGMTVMAAIATAGGFTYRANEKTVMIQRFGETVEKSFPLSPQTIVLPGDTIRVKERYF
ncbi:polysaccharide export protein [Sphingomonas sp. DBB INV C78]|uniref:polysaccharide biosynthesis/export family protein n=1 Tax=Sphingomonas sp. DBB INV C78 TaxID=3349434 RepID=UPI0036D28C7B